MRLTRLKTARQAAWSAVAGLLLASTLVAQDAASTLESQLGTIFKITQVEMVGHNVTSQGTVVKVAKENFLFQTPVGQPVTCTATVKDGKASVPSTGCRFMMKNNGGFLPEGSRLYITKIRANLPKDTVTLELTDAAVDPTSGGLGHPSQKTAVNFVFAKDFLAKADASQVADVISTTLAADTPAAAAAPASEAQPAAAPPPQMMQVALGMTEEQVLSILGQPNKQQMGAGQSKVYIYHKQIVFQNGKVSAIE